MVQQGRSICDLYAWRHGAASSSPLSASAPLACSNSTPAAINLPTATALADLTENMVAVTCRSARAGLCARIRRTSPSSMLVTS